jgi:hypothetical protein
MAKMTKAEIVAALRDEISQSEGYDSDELAEVREKALDYYYGRPRGDELEGRSQVISMDVADMVEAVLAQVLPAFQTDNVVEFEPDDQDDERQASQESEAVNYMINEVNNGYSMFYEAIKDALLQRNGIIKVWVDETVQSESQQFESISSIELSMLVLNDDPNLQVEVTDSEENSDGTLNVTLKVTQTTRKLRVSAVPPENFLFSVNHDSIYLDNIPFCAERDLVSRSDLIEAGYSKSVVKDLPVMTMDTKNDSNARNRNDKSNIYAGNEPSQDMIEVYYCYYLIDADGDGVAERHFYTLAGNQILDDEPAEFVPYASGTPFIQPATLRNYLDNHNNANNARLGVVDGLVNMDDALNSRPGGVIRMNSTDGIVPIPRDDVGQSAQALLQYMDEVRSARGGASLDLQTASAQIAGDTAHGVERQYTAREQLAALMARTLAETLIASTYKMTHKAMRLLMPGTFNFRVEGMFGQTDPSEWRERERVNVKTGLSVNERMAKAASLAEIVAKQEQYIMQGQGGIMTDANKLHNALIDWAKAKGLDNPERYWTDPQSPQAQQAQQQAAQAQQEAEQQQQAMMVQQAQFQEKLLQIQAELDKYKHDTELKYKYWSDILDAEVDEAKIVGDAATKINLERVKQDAQQQQDQQAGSETTQ